MSVAGELQDVAAATDRHPSQPSRWRSGARHGVPFRTFQYVAALARHPRTDPYPFLQAQQAEVMRAEFEHQGTLTLIKLWHELRDREAMVEAEEEITSRGRDRGAYRAALLKEAAIQVRLAAVDEELERRGVEPNMYRGDGWRIA